MGFRVLRQALRQAQDSCAQDARKETRSFGVEAEGEDSHRTVFRRSRKLWRKWNKLEPQAATAKEILGGF